ncbi:MAG: c-type cytochrome [Pseudomonadota bacterium]
MSIVYAITNWTGKKRSAVMSKYLMAIAALALMMSGCGQDEEPMEEQAAEETAVQQEADMATDSMQDETGTAEEEGEAMDNDVEPTNGEDQTEGDALLDESSSTSEEVAAEAETDGADGDSSQGKQVYDNACFTCHAQGIAGAPRLDDKAAWEPRIAKGMETLVSHAIDGFQGDAGVMPPKGGFMNLSDEEVRAAVAYMVEQAE